MSARCRRTRTTWSSIRGSACWSSRPTTAAVRRRARATTLGDAEALAPESARYAEARTLYLQRFPDAVDTFALADFSLFAIGPAAVRFIGGVAHAASLTPEVFALALREV